MNNKILRWSLIASFAGFLFGFDTVVISGADKTLQLLWNSSDVFHGSVVMAMALTKNVTITSPKLKKPLDASQAIFSSHFDLGGTSGP